MNATAIHESEIVTRSIARWGSAAAFIIFGVAFVTDRALSWHIVSTQVVQIGLIVAIFAGYALALTKQTEALGSVIALLCTIAAYVAYMVALALMNNPPPKLFFFALGVPALFHLVAMVLHRYGLNRTKS